LCMERMSDGELHEIKAVNTQKLHEIKAAKVIVLYLTSNSVCCYVLLLLIWLRGGCVGFSAKVFSWVFLSYCCP